MSAKLSDQTNVLFVEQGVTVKRAHPYKSKPYPARPHHPLRTRPNGRQLERPRQQAKHQANHIQVHYANNASAADECIFPKASALGLQVTLCGTLRP